MDICSIISTPIPPVEGIGFYAWNLSRYLNRYGHNVHIITRGGTHLPSREITDGITIWRPPFLPLYPLHVHFHSFFVEKLVQELEPELDLLHLHTPLVKFPNSRLPAIVTIHTPMKADVGSVQSDTILGFLTKLQLPFSILLEKQLLDNARQITVVAISVAHELGNYGIEPNQIEVLGNGVDTHTFFPTNRKNKANIDPYILNVGRLGPRKGLKDLIHCANVVIKEYPNVRFYIAGTGPSERNLRNYADRLELSQNIIFLGHITDRERLADLYRGAAAYVHAAHYEGLPTVLLEAMACALPVVATAVSGALDVIEDEHNGLLVPPQKPGEMAQAILRLLNNPDLGNQLGLTAHKTIEEKYSWEVVSRQYLIQYEKLVEGFHT